MISDFLIYSFNSLKARKTRTLLTMIGIFIGIASVVSLISLGSGFQNAVLSQFSQVGNDKLVVQAAETGFGPPGSTALKRLDDDDFNAVKKVSGVKAAAKRYIRAAKIEFNDETIFSVMSSMPQDVDGRKLVIDSLNLKIADGRMLKPSDNYKVLVGNSFFEKERFSRKLSSGDKIKINGFDFEIAGVMEKFGNPQFNDMVMINEGILENVLDIESEADLIAVQIVDVKNIENIADDIKKTLRKSRNVDKSEEDFSVETPQEVIESFNTVINVVNIVIIGIAAISLIVGGIGIMNTMYTSVFERRREIGIMKSIGATNRDILTIFLIESGILGLVGGLIGVFIGVGFSELVEVFAGGILRADTSLFLIVGSLMFSFLVGAISGILPAKQAALLQPVDALRL